MIWIRVIDSDDKIYPKNQYPIPYSGIKELMDTDWDKLVYLAKEFIARIELYHNEPEPVVFGKFICPVGYGWTTIYEEKE